MTAKRRKVLCPAFCERKLAVGKAEPYGLKSNAMRCKKETRDKAARARRAIGRRPGPVRSKLPHQTQEAPRLLPRGFLLCALRVVHHPVLGSPEEGAVFVQVCHHVFPGDVQIARALYRGAAVPIDPLYTFVTRLPVR